MRKKAPEKEGNTERYLLTYSDLITLLMIFFVVMYSMSNIDKTKYQQVAQSLNKALGNGGGGGNSIIAPSSTGTGTSSSDTLPPVDTTLVEESQMQDLKTQIDNYLNSNNLKGSVSATIQEKGLVISINDTLFFDTGKAEIRPESVGKLIAIGKMLNQINNYIMVEGHTDNVPITGGKFADNWELSVIRATNVVKLLINQSGIPQAKIYPSGYADNRPVADNSTEAGRAKNRRVDIIILSSKFNQVAN
jgi:chemotaxis protein MotB